jgi:hypothetical protein
MNGRDDDGKAYGHPTQDGAPIRDGAVRGRFRGGRGRKVLFRETIVSHGSYPKS